MKRPESCRQCRFEIGTIAGMECLFKMFRGLDVEVNFQERPERCPVSRINDDDIEKMHDDCIEDVDAVILNKALKELGK